MKKFMQQHGMAAVTWFIVVVLAIVFMPDVNALVRDNGAVKLPSDVQSQVATRIQKKANGKPVRTYTAVFANGDHRLTHAQTRLIDRRLHQVKSEQGLHITAIMRPNDNAQTRKQLIAKDKSTQLAQITVREGALVKTQVQKLRSQLAVKGVKTYVTGADALNDDFTNVTEKGIQKTEVIAIVFIFIVLIIVFRSPIVPILSLLNVGVAFITSLSIVMNLAAHLNFPISNFTQVFMVIVLFGIGTDYNILLYDYFKSELAKGKTALEATRETRRHGGRTVLYSGVSVLIGFSVLWLAKFSFYQSASAVAIGVLILLPVLLSLNMFFMATLGEKMFWPSKLNGGESASKLWYGLSRASMSKPALWLAGLVVLAVPFTLAMMQVSESFNNAEEVPSTYQSKQGYLVIEDHFSKGMTAPATVYIQSKTPLDTPAKLAAIDHLTQYLQKEPGVKTVASVTEPGGNKLDQMYLRSQLTTITDGLKASEKGLTTIKAGLSGANRQLKAQDIAGGVGQVTKLANGTDQLQRSMSQMQSGLTAYTAGVAQANRGAQQLSGATGQLQAGAQTLDLGAGRLASGAGQAVSGAQQLAQGTAAVSKNTAKLSAAAGQLQAGTGALNEGITGLQASQAKMAPTLGQLQKQLTAYQAEAKALIAYLNQQPGMGKAMGAQASQAVQGLTAGLSQITQGAAALNSGMTAAGSNVPKLNAGAAALANGANRLSAGTGQVDQGTQKLAASLAALAGGTKQATSGIDALATGAGQTAQGAATLAAGTSQLAAKSGALTSGAGQLASGSKQVNAGVQQLSAKLTQMSSQLTKLESGLGSASAGLTALKSGSASMDDYLTQMKGSYMGNQFYLPQTAIKAKAFRPALNAYMADHRKITTMTVVFKGDPNSDLADKQFGELNRDLKAEVKHGSLASAKVAIGGQTAQNHDLRSLANGDFLRTASIMVIGIFIALIVVTESVLQPLTIMGTLVTAYVTSMGITRLLSKLVLGRPLLSWNTPFFTFIMLMALGVDYSIFLMIRFRDGRAEPDVKLRMLKAATTIGTVVLSAAVILGGTFAALMPSGVTTLIQVALGVIIGLVLLVILLPIAMSALVSLTEWHQAREHRAPDQAK
ncbi:MMPL family transporter [Lacticaseibacillus jixianensis]|uniref:MMPL family transporter n=1 Tax=Lacticaseibacillus jixianensis TaxID=2486012 RepID=A0ABW4BCR7_9LACO|nr:MMPL family transporter [Lacticaseibacillus jixianensis]